MSSKVIKHSKTHSNEPREKKKSVLQTGAKSPSKHAPNKQTKNLRSLFREEVPEVVSNKRRKTSSSTGGGGGGRVGVVGGAGSASNKKEGAKAIQTKPLSKEAEQAQAQAQAMVKKGEVIKVVPSNIKDFTELKQVLKAIATPLKINDDYGKLVEEESKRYKALNKMLKDLMRNTQTQTTSSTTTTTTNTGANATAFEDNKPNQPQSSAKDPKMMELEEKVNKCIEKNNKMSMSHRELKDEVVKQIRESVHRFKMGRAQLRWYSLFLELGVQDFKESLCLSCASPLICQDVVFLKCGHTVCLCCYSQFRFYTSQREVMKPVLDAKGNPKLDANKNVIKKKGTEDYHRKQCPLCRRVIESSENELTPKYMQKEIEEAHRQESQALIRQLISESVRNHSTLSDSDESDSDDDYLEHDLQRSGRQGVMLSILGSVLQAPVSINSLRDVISLNGEGSNVASIAPYPSSSSSSNLPSYTTPITIYDSGEGEQEDGSDSSFGEY